MNISRRDALKGIIGTSAAAFAAGSFGSTLLAQDKPWVFGGGVAAGKHEVKALPFNAAKLKDLSEKMITNHHAKNYAGAVKNLNKVEESLAATNKDTNLFELAGLRRAELTYTNSIIYHEHYFGNLGGDGKMSGRIDKVLGELYGSKSRWEEAFIQTGMSLGGGSGWAVVDYNLHTNEIRTYWADNHTMSPAFAMPLLVMDMFEHAYQLDFGPNHAKYIEVFFDNINWEEVNRRLERAESLAKILKA